MTDADELKRIWERLNRPTGDRVDWENTPALEAVHSSGYWGIVLRPHGTSIQDERWIHCENPVEVRP